MRYQFTIVVVVVSSLLFFLPYLSASEVVPWLAPTSIGGFNLDVYYVYSRKGIELRVTGHDIPYDLHTRKLNMKATFRPLLGLEVCGLAGMINSELEGGDTLKGDFDGTFFGVGIRYVFLGDMIILPVVCWQFLLSHSCYGYNKENGKGIDFRLQDTEVEGSIITSKRLGIFAPYAGIKFFHDWLRWKDKVPPRAEGKGKGGDTSLFIGIRILLGRDFSFVGEAGFLDEVNYTGGVSLSFGI